MKYITILEASKKYGLSEWQINRFIGTILLSNTIDKENNLCIVDDQLEQFLLDHPPDYKTCLDYPSDDYITHSFSNRLCNHIHNKSKLCIVRDCPLLHLEKTCD